MRKNGFTLVEVIAVIVVLGVLLAISVPSVSKIINDGYLRGYEISLNEMANIAKAYINTEEVVIEDKDRVFITVTEMVSSGLMSPVQDPKNDTECDGYVMVYRDRNNYEFTPFLNCAGNYVSEDYGKQDYEAPVITLLGSKVVNIKTDDIYTDAGATATDNIDGDITSRIVATGVVDPNTVGAYTITYNVSDNDGNAATPVTRTVNVVDVTGPSIAFSMNGNSAYAKTRSTTVTVSDNRGVNTSSLKYQWNTNTTAPSEASFTTAFTNGGTLSSPAGVTGGYYLWILAKDIAGNTAIINTNVFNLDNIVPSVPTVNFNGYTVGTWTTSNITIGFSATDAESGIQKYQYTADGSNWFDLTNPYIVNTDGDYWRAYRSVDVAGNTSVATGTFHFGRDTTAPSVPNTNFNGYTLGTWSRVNMTLNLSSTDATSGIMTYQWSSDGATWHDMPSTWLYNYDTNQSTRFRAVDNAGNAGSPTSACSIKRDTVAPVITMNGSNPVNIVQGSTYTDAGAVYTDGLSGIAGAGVYASNINPNIVGSYYVIYYATDNAGNSATQLTRTVNVISSTTNFSYTGNVQTFNVPATGTYKMEVWGAQGGGTNGGRGGYSIGEINLTAGQTLSIYVGEKPTSGSGGYNGGGSGTYMYNSASGTFGGFGGGGATDIRLNGTALANRIIVAGGGGGHWTDTGGGYGGGSTGGSGTGSTTGGSQYSGGGYGGTLGIGGGTNGSGGSWAGGGGGGGGYYGGGGNGTTNCSGAGGSGYVGTLQKSQTMSGNASMPAPGGGNETGHTGHGYARITYITPNTNITTFAYNGNVQTFTVPTSGPYKLEVWGAQGGGLTGGAGGYATGQVNLTAGQVLNIYVGGQPDSSSGGYNGGGSGTYMYNSGTGTYGGYGGGGATDIRLNGTALGNRIIVAGGGGGAWTVAGGYGGGTSGGPGSGTTGGTQSSGGSYGGTLGIGGGTNGSGGYWAGGGGGGGGYYGGGGNGTSNYSGAGGSGYTGSLSSPQTIAGNASMPGQVVGTEVGHLGNGYAKITYMGS